MPSGVTEKLQVIRLIHCLTDRSRVNLWGVYREKVKLPGTFIQHIAQAVIFSVRGSVSYSHDKQKSRLIVYSLLTKHDVSSFVDLKAIFAVMNIA